MPETTTTLGKLGGLKGGPARAKALSAKRRTQIAKAAAAARWGDIRSLSNFCQPSHINNPLYNQLYCIRFLNAREGFVSRFPKPE